MKTMQANNNRSKAVAASPRLTEQGRYLKVFGGESEQWAWKAAAVASRKSVGDWARDVLNKASKQ